MGQQNSACAQQFQRTKKTHSSDAASRKQRVFEREVQTWAKFMKVGSRLAKSRFEKHLHAYIAASHLGWFKVGADALQTCLGQLEIQSQLRRAVHGKSDAPEPQCTTKAGIQRSSLMCKIKNTVKVEKRKRGVLEKMAHQTLSKKPPITTTHTLGKRASKMVQQDKKIHTSSRTPFPKNAAKLLTKEIRSVTLHVDTTPG